MLFYASTAELDGWISWGEKQIEYALFLFMFIVLIFLAFKRAWILLIGTIIALAVFAALIYEPTMLIKLAEWLAYRLKQG